MEESHLGIFVVLFGIIALVMGGIGITTMSDQKSTRLSQSAALTLEIDSNQDRLKSLREEISSKTRTAAEYEIEGRKLEATLQQSRIEVASLQLRQESLAQKRTELVEQIPEIRHDLAAAQMAKKEALRRSMIGAYLGDVSTTRRTYRQVRVTGFEPGAMRIVCQRGPATLPLSTLPANLKERIGWDPIEEDLERQIPRTDRTPSPNIGKAAAPSEADIARAQADFASAKAEMDQTQRSLEEAQSQIGGSRKSPPGSLETYQERAQRLSRLLEQQRLRYEDSRNTLIRVHPNDSLLRR
ncbi:chromosome segregation ATPase [Haloferula luteola]|uniref:Chromosome segregation ATPase n=1 Tax=Haloferula luteola TaxID=595692 RepID=A0A840V3H1_9BACT|nr:hypothetical protein [Haloferula luteola]MBB5352847.1 chromosome segregation ATPase [Haloferula luteola]